jgi:hypothetical protein
MFDSAYLRNLDQTGLSGKYRTYSISKLLLLQVEETSNRHITKFYSEDLRHICQTYFELIILQV